MKRVLVCLVLLFLFPGPALGITDPVFTLDSEGDFQAAIGSASGNRIVPMTADDWSVYGSAFAGLAGSSFAESSLFASAGGLVETEDGQVNLPAGMGMSWGPVLDGSVQQEGQYVGGWQFSYAEDPNLLGSTLIVDAMPPAISPATGFAINTLGIGLVDGNSRVRSWTFGVVPPPPPPTAGSLTRNALNFVRIQVRPAGSAGAGDARYGQASPFGPFPLNNALFFETPGFDPTNVVSIIGIENGLVPAGGTIPAPPPGGANRSQWNWWGVIAVQPTIPEPLTLLLTGSALAGLGSYLRRRR